MSVCFARTEREFRKVFSHMLQDDMRAAYTHAAAKFINDPFPSVRALCDWGWRVYHEGCLPSAVRGSWPVWTREQVNGICRYAWKRFFS